MSADPQTEERKEHGSRFPEPADLVLAIQQGDREAEREFVDCYLSRVRTLFLTRTRNRDLAEDLVQDTMLELIRALRRGQLREADKLTHFVLAVARNLLNSHFRRSSRQPEPLEAPDEIADLRSQTEDNEEQRRYGLAAKAIEKLDPTDRAILQMTLVDGLKPGVIAEKLGLNPDVVRQRKLRATRKLQDSMRTMSQKLSDSHLMSRRKL